MSVQTTITRQDPNIEAYRLGLLRDVQGLIRNQMFGQQVQNLRGQGFSDQEISEQLAVEQVGQEGDDDYIPGVSAEDQLGLIEGISPGAAFGLPAFQVAGLTRPQMDAVRLAEAGVGAYQPYIAQGSGAIRQGIESLAGVSDSFDPSGYKEFMSPFQQEVIDSTVEDLESNFQRRQAQERNRIAAKAASTGNIQTSGFERAKAQTLDPAQEAFDKQLNATVANLQQSGFTDSMTRAQQAFQNARNRQLQGAQMSGALGVQAIGAGEAEQGFRGRDINALMQTGGMLREVDQGALEAQRMTNLQSYQQPFTSLGFLSDVYAGIPTSQSQQVMNTGSSASPFMQAASAGIAGLSAYGGAKQAGIL